MLHLIGMSNCAMCERSKKLLNDHNIEFKFRNIAEDDEAMEIAQKFNVKTAGKFLYDDEKNEVIEVTKYIDQLS